MLFRSRTFHGLAFAVLICLLIGMDAAPAAFALQTPSRWTLADQAGDRWGLVLLQQDDPAYPSGWRLRLNALGTQSPLDHQRPLLLEDGQGGIWQLANRSEELAPPGAPSPSGSAQFDATGLWPVPRTFLPLHLQVPQAGNPDEPDRQLVLGAEPVLALVKLAQSLTADG